MTGIRRTLAGTAALVVLVGHGSVGHRPRAELESECLGLGLRHRLCQRVGGEGTVTFTYGDTSEPSGLNPMVGYLGTDYTFWAMNYDLLVNFSTKDFSPDFAHSITTSVDTSSDGRPSPTTCVPT